MAVIIQMIDGMGRDWCFTFVAAVLFFTSPLLWVVMRWGQKWREERRARFEMQKREEESREVEKDKVAVKSDQKDGGTTIEGEGLAERIGVSR